MKSSRLTILTILVVSLITNSIATGWMDWKGAGKTNAAARPFFVPDDADVAGVIFSDGFESGDLSFWQVDKPGEIKGTKPINGLRPGEKINAIENIPAGVGEDKLSAITNFGVMFDVDCKTGNVDFKGAAVPLISEQNMGYARNPLNGFMHASNIETGEHAILDPNNAGVIAFGRYFYPPDDPGAGSFPRIPGLAYGNPSPREPLPKLWAIDSVRNTLVKIDEQTGEVRTQGSLGVDTNDIVGFDIAPKNDASEKDRAFASLTNPNTNKSVWYEVDLDTGQATERGDIGNEGNRYAAIAVVKPVPPMPTILLSCDIDPSDSVFTIVEAFKFTVTVRNGIVPVPNADVGFTVTSGPNQGTNVPLKVTDENGEAEFEYKNELALPGKDTIEVIASALNLTSKCTTTVEWQDIPTITTVTTHTGGNGRNLEIIGAFKNGDIVEINDQMANKVKFKNCDGQGTCQKIIVKKGVKQLKPCPDAVPVQNFVQVSRLGNPSVFDFSTCP